jgi:hypothetical protein
MAGGIYQLIAQGVDTLYLINEPEISLFKIVYKRYTNFSVEEIDLNFDGNISFGGKQNLTIPKNGDLLYKILLKVTLPKINIIKKNESIVEKTKSLLKKCDINWKTSSDVLTRDIYENEIKKLILRKQNKNEKYNNIFARIINTDYKSNIDLYEDMLNIINNKYNLIKIICSGLISYMKDSKNFKFITLLSVRNQLESKLLQNLNLESQINYKFYKSFKNKKILLEDLKNYSLDFRESDLYKISVKILNNDSITNINKVIDEYTILVKDLFKKEFKLFL